MNRISANHMIHTYLGITINVSIVYKKSTAIGISIDGYGNIEVSVPKGTSDEQIIRILEKNWEMLQQKLNEMKDRMSGPKEKMYQPGEGFLYLGMEYPINISQDPTVEKDRVLFEEDILHIYVRELDDKKIQQALKRFYYRQCKTLVEKRVRFYQDYFKMKPRSITISDSKTTWGTCDSKMQLTFNWRLAMAPLHVIDYVVVHEMCHMVHLNHDRSFWRLVGKIMPNYKEMEQWLAASSWKMTV